jgi:protein gp37
VIAARFSGPGQPYEGLARRKRIVEDGTGESATVARWTGEVRFIEEALDLPLRWKSPKRIFVNSMSDLFHEKVEDGWIDAIFSVMEHTPRHTYQVLTKRPERMMESMQTMQRRGYPVLPNVWLGVSIENQAAMDQRISDLQATPAAVQFLSIEPLLGPVEIPKTWLTYKGTQQWVIIGGESGPHARPCDLDWIRDVVAQCYGVPVFVKQLGANVYDSDLTASGRIETVNIRDRKGSDPAEWPEDLRIQQFPVAHADNHQVR